jgi:hypothetical protein
MENSREVPQELKMELSHKPVISLSKCMFRE